MSEPRVNDDVAEGYGEVCEKCDEMKHFCICSPYDRLEDLE